MEPIEVRLLHQKRILRGIEPIGLQDECSGALWPPWHVEVKLEPILLSLSLST